MTRLPALLLAASALFGQGREYIEAHYTKYEQRIAMRDGARLFTAVYTPKDASRPYPILLLRTPYGVAPYGADNYPEGFRLPEKFAKEGYIFVFQDVRGRYLSEGSFVNVRPHNPRKRSPADVDESSDTWDAIDWLVKNVPNNNGRAGMWGISYPGFYASMGAIGAHPALRAVSPQAPVTDWFVGDDFHHNGALYLIHMLGFFGFFRPFAEPAPKTLEAIDYGFVDAYDALLKAGPLTHIEEKLLKRRVPFYDDIVAHPDYDEFWKARDVRPHLKAIQPAVMTVGGWFDAEDLFGTLETYRAIEKGSPGAVNTLVMGPWYHGGWGRSDGDRLGEVRFRSKTSKFFQEEAEFPFFEHYLKGKANPGLPEALVFETGSNVWRRHESWPPPGAAPRRLYFQAGGKLAFDPPETGGTGFDEYVSDPARPVPFVSSIEKTMTREHMAADQRFAAARPDVLVYATPPLEQDLTVAGPLRAALYVSTTGTDSDWVVKLIDVYPDNYPDNDPNPAGVTMGGYQQLVRGEPFRGRYRDGFDKPRAFTPGKAEKVEFTLPDVYHNFRSGHRVMVQVQSSWFPLVDRNPQQFVNIYKARPEDFGKATQRVYREAGRASSIEVMVAR